MQYNKFCCETVTQLQNSNVGVAQLDRAFGYGPKGRGFESSRPRLKALQREVLFLYNRKLHFLLYKKPLAGCALRRTMMMSQAVYVPLRSLLNERHRRSATPQALECAKAHSLFYFIRNITGGFFAGIS